MGQKVNPISNRLGIIRGWDSNWFGGKNFGDNLVEDKQIRTYLKKRLEKAQVSRIIIERTLKLVTITICTARPGIVIGKAGHDVDKLKEELKKLYKKESRSTFSRLSVLSLTPQSLVRTSQARLNTSWLIAVPSRWLCRTQCAQALKA